MEIPIIRDGVRRRSSSGYHSRSRDRPTLFSAPAWPRTSLFNATFGPWVGGLTSDTGTGNRHHTEEVTYRFHPNDPPSPGLIPHGPLATAAREMNIPIEVTSTGTFPRTRDRRVIDTSAYVVGNHDMTPGSSLTRPIGRRALVPGTSSGSFDADTRVGSGTGTSHGGLDTNSRASFHTYHDYNDSDKVAESSYRDTPVNSPETPQDEPVDQEKLLNIDKVDAHVYENGRAHHTERFHVVDSGGLVVRRGQGFELTVSLDRKFVEGEDDLKFVAENGKQPLPGKGTYVTFTLYQPDVSGQWKAKVTRMMGYSATVTIETATDAIVGEWRLTVAAASRKGVSRAVTGRDTSQIPVYILFNPWCKGDSVYFPDQAKLSEYVLNDNGCIFFGTHSQIGANPWFFGQFEPGILEAAIYCLNKAFSFRSSQALGDPVRVTRAISKIVNSNDDKGVVVGNWSGSYIGGKAPLSWTGSVEILRQYMRTHSPVKYGQCFVFSGIVTTVCRCLGIPCRSVTNFSSAHDTDASVTVDVHWDATAEGDTSMDHLNTDSIWNFHVWNDVWMRRADQPGGNDGWQVLDATPQERSAGVFQCGPAPLAAIRSGQCDVGYDTAFVFAEVNADRVHWGRAPSSDWSVIDVERSVVGKKISTKVPDGRPTPPNLSDCEHYREDITQQYKHPDDSDRERISVINAGRTTNAGRVPGIHHRRRTDIKLSISNKDHVLIGSDFETTVSVENTSREPRTVSGNVICDVISYTGRRISSCRTDKLDLTIEPRTVQNHTVKISGQDYLQYVNEAAIVRISVIGRVKETGSTVALVDNFRLRVPDLQIKMMSSVSYMGSLLQFKVCWKNPLNKKLTNCVIRAECPGMEGDTSVPLGSIGALQDVQTVVGCRVQKAGLKQIYVTLECDQLHNVKGVDEIFVQGNR